MVMAHVSIRPTLATSESAFQEMTVLQRRSRMALYYLAAAGFKRS
jgi:hypothetical protein